MTENRTRLAARLLLCLSAALAIGIHSPSARADPPSSFVPAAGELRFRGLIRSVAHGSFVLLAQTVTTHQRDTTTFARPRAKRIALTPHCLILRENSRKSPADIVPGLWVVVIGQDLGEGKPMRARLIYLGAPVKVTAAPVASAPSSTPSAPSEVTSVPVPSGAAAVPDADPVAVTHKVALMETQVVEAINRIRAAAGKAPLALRPELTQAARAQSESMRAASELSHVDAQGDNLDKRLSEAGYTEFQAVAENVAVTDSINQPVEQAVQGWQKSEQHHANIVDTGYTETGVGVAEKDGQFYITQIFARRYRDTGGDSGPLLSDAGDEAATASSIRNAARILELINFHRHEHGLADIVLNPKLNAAAQADSAAFAKQLRLHTNVTDTDELAAVARYLARALYTPTPSGRVVANRTLGLDDPDRVVAAWMQKGGSARLNLLSPDLTEIGVGYSTATSGDGPIDAWSILFAMSK